VCACVCMFVRVAQAMMGSRCTFSHFECCRLLRAACVALGKLN